MVSPFESPRACLAESCGVECRELAAVGVGAEGIAAYLR
jgi:hypothetical protein